jgi:hypothetical protein
MRPTLDLIQKALEKSFADCTNLIPESFDPLVESFCRGGMIRYSKDKVEYFAGGKKLGENKRRLQ